MKKYKRLASTLSAIALPGLLLVVVPDAPRVSYDDFHLVLGGMDQAEVEAVFGIPPAREQDMGSKSGQGIFSRPGARMLTRDGYEGHAGVTFDSTGLVIDKSYTPRNPVTRRGYFVRRLDRLKEWWKRWAVTQIRE